MVKKIYIPQAGQGGIYKRLKESGEYPSDKIHSSKTELIIKKRKHNEILKVVQ